MKKLSLFGVVVLSIAMLASGCHRKPTRETPIPGINPPPGQENNNPPPGGAFNPEPPVTTVQPNPTGYPEGNGRWAPLFENGRKDRDKFAADTVYFDFDRSTIKASEESKLQEVASYFKSNTTDALIIEGNCDERGTEKYNLSLGERRALAAREYLINLGVDSQRIKTVTYGASKPVDPGHNEEAWKKNRRDDMVLVTAR
jgi:peptidoglycan-associated lipoprotein